MTNLNGRKRVVITGMGVATPLGTGVDKTWSRAKKGEIGVGPIESFDIEDLHIKIAGEVSDFDPRQDLRSRDIFRGDRYSQLAGISAQEAVDQSGLEVPFIDAESSACIVGSGIGGLMTLENSYRDLFIKKRKATNPLTLLKAIGSSGAAHLSMEYGVKGPCFGTVSACSTATHAMGLVYQMIQQGQVKLGIAGASEAVINYGSLRAWQALHVLSPEGCRPFSKDRNGTVLAEGAGILILEELEYAKARGAKILGELVGFGMTSDAKDMVNPSMEGPANAMLIALNDAGLSTSDIDYVNAHGTATKVNDVNETKAIRKVFGKDADNLLVSSTKSMHGHTLGACGAIEAAICLKAMEEGFVPPTASLDEVDPECDLDYVPNVGREKTLNYVMSNSFAFGGLNATIILGPAPQ
ncbi:MAG: beta-ketoacyl-[acyl-carrier-protein] synthase family protein [Methyloligellaceae bacterium]